MLFIALVVAALTTVTARAADSTFRLQVLPINCLFEVVSDGSNQIVYLTPEECGQLVKNPPGAEQPAPGSGQPEPPITTPTSLSPGQSLVSVSQLAQKTLPDDGKQDTDTLNAPGGSPPAKEAEPNPGPLFEWQQMLFLAGFGGLLAWTVHMVRGRLLQGTVRTPYD